MTNLLEEYELNKILIIEDSPIFLLILKKFLQNHVKSDNISTIAEFFTVNLDEYSIILLDLSLPDSQGIDTITTVVNKAQKPIIVISGTNDFNIIKKCINLGAQDYLVKNQFDQNLLLKSILFAYERYQRIQFEHELSLVIEEITKLRSDFKDLQADFSEIKSVLWQR